jgi:hypothetical protein
MATITTRSGKGSALTHTELDNNFSNLNSDKVEASGDTITGNLSFNDNAKAQFGASSDLQIYHDGGNSRILENGTGFLAVGTNGTDIRLTGNSFTEFMAKFEQDGPVTLYHNNAEKLATTSTGIDVTGSISADGLTVDGEIIGPNSNNLTIRSKFSATIDIDSDNNQTDRNFQVIHDGSKLLLKAEESGDISFYEDTGTTAKFFWDSSAESLGIGTTNVVSSANLTTQAQSSSELSGMAMKDEAGANTSYVFVGGSTHSVSAYRGHLNLYANNELKMYTNASTTPKLVVDTGGNVGIGTDSPQGPLQVQLSSARNLVVDFDTEGDSRTSLRSIENTANLLRPIQIEGQEIVLGTAAFDQAVSSEAMRIDSAGRVGIGTSSPSAKLQVDDGAGSAFFVGFANSNYYRSGQHVFQSLNNTSEYMRIDSSGNLLVGKTSVDTSVAGTVLSSGKYIFQTRDSAAPLLLRRNTSDGDIAQFYKDGTTVGSIGTKSGDLTIGTGDTGVRFDDANNAIYAHNTTTNVYSDATVDLGYSGIRFKDLYLSGGLRGDTTFKNNAGTTEYARFDASGSLLVGQTTQTPNDVGISLNANGNISAKRDDGIVGLFNRGTSDGTIADFRKDGVSVGSIGTRNGTPYFANSVGEGIRIIDGYVSPCDSSGNGSANTVDLGSSAYEFKDLYLSGTANVEKVTAERTNGVCAEFRRSNDGHAVQFFHAGSLVGSVAVTSTATAYNTSSDQRLKENIADADDAGSKIDAIQVRKFDWIADGSHQDYGMVAQELNTVAPEAVTEGDTEEDMMSVDYSKLVPMLVKEIQSLRARVAQLETN